MEKKALKSILLCIIYSVILIAMMCFLYENIIDSIDWLIFYLIRPMMIPVFLLLIISLLLAIIYCLIQKKSLIITSISIFACAVLGFFSVSALFTVTSPNSAANYIDTVDIKNIGILTDPNPIIETNPGGMLFFSKLGKQAFEYNCEAEHKDNIERENDYNITQESLYFDNMFFVNRKKLQEHLTFYYIEKDIWGLGITEDDIHSFTTDNISCTYVYKNKSNENYYFNELAYYSFVVYTDEKIFFNSYYVRETVPFDFSAEETTERLVNELKSKGCL